MTWIAPDRLFDGERFRDGLALRLEDGRVADLAAVDRAYRRLIKQHHPDRTGGDSSRAAEINRAYREIRGGKAVTDPLQFNEAIAPGRRRSRWPTAALIACSVAIGALLPSDRARGAARSAVAIPAE